MSGPNEYLVWPWGAQVFLFDVFVCTIFLYTGEANVFCYNQSGHGNDPQKITGGETLKCEANSV